VWVPALRCIAEEALHRVRDTIVEDFAVQGSHERPPLRETFKFGVVP
jgi:hypothetical protein